MKNKTCSGSLVLDLRIEMTPYELTLDISRLKLECYYYVNRTKRVYDKVLVTKFCVFLTRRGTVICEFFGRLRKIFIGKKSQGGGYPWENSKYNFFFLMCHDWHFVNEHSLLSYYSAVLVLNSNLVYFAQIT